MINGYLSLSTAPTSEPVTVEEARDYLRVDTTLDDMLLTGMIKAARQDAETITRRALFTQTWNIVLDEWPCESTIDLPLPPLQSVTHIKYYDAADVEYTFAATNYVVDAVREPGRITLKSNASWPTGTTLRVARGIYIQFVCGYTTLALIPQPVKQAVLLMVADFYEHRENTMFGSAVHELPRGIDRLLWPYRVMSF